MDHLKQTQQMYQTQHQAANVDAPLKTPPTTKSFRKSSFSSNGSSGSSLGSSPAVSSEKEYRDKILKLQMDNLIPLKEDVADWLNRILSMAIQIVGLFQF